MVVISVGSGLIGQFFFFLSFELCNLGRPFWFVDSFFYNGFIRLQASFGYGGIRFFYVLIVGTGFIVCPSFTISY